jgi:23S rRNA pseudouridine1911/1915/1917 synthase
MGSPMRWVARPGDGETVGEILLRAGADEHAVAEGRVFLGRRRVRSATEAVRDGDIVQVAPARAKAAGPTVLVRTADLVAVDKPAGVATIADHSGASQALTRLVADALGFDPARVHPTSRLDRDVSGVVVFALTREAAERLAMARSRGTYSRRYVAIAARAPDVDRGTWSAAIGRARDPRLREAEGRDAVAAQTHYVTCARIESGIAMLAVMPVTGRTHQIRVHASYASAPLIGDRSYGGPVRITLPGGRVIEPGRVALHAARVVVPDVRGAPLTIEAPLPSDLLGLWDALGGDAAAWEVATSCVLPSSPLPCSSAPPVR